MAEITMPKLSDTMTEGTLVAWKKKKGDKISSGDVIAEVETDKATMEMEAFEEGVLTEIFVQEGQKVSVGDKIALVGAAGATAAKPDDKATADKQPVPAAEKAAAGAGTALAPATASGSELAEAASVADASDAADANGSHGPAAPAGASDRVKASPLAKKTAAAQGISLGNLTGSGPGGRIIQRDVLGAAPAPAAPAAAAAPAPKPADRPAAPASSPAPRPPAPRTGAFPAQTETRTALSGMRKTIADRLLASKTQIPHFYLHVEVDTAALTKLRAEVNKAGEKDGAKVSINDFILKAAAKALAAVPKVNASFAGDSVIQYGSVFLAVAVAVEDGLITPVIKNADSKSLLEISYEVKDLAARARGKKLKPEEYQGGTFTVSNLGSYGIDRFDAIVNPPQSAILSVGGVMKKPVVNAAGEVVAGERMDLGLSCDHRVVDGALGAQFLAELKRLLESPLLLLL